MLGRQVKRLSQPNTIYWLQISNMGRYQRLW